MASQNPFPTALIWTDQGWRPLPGDAGITPIDLNAECFDITLSGIAFPGPLIDPDDIGPAVQAAGNAALAVGGGTICIPRRDTLNAVGKPYWGWTSPVNLSAARDKNITIRGTNKGASIIQIPLASNLSLLALVNLGLGEVRDLIFVGDAGAGINVANLISIRECRLSLVHGNQIWGVRANADEQGVLECKSDSNHVYDNFFVGCDYDAFSLGPMSGGVLTVRGCTDFDLIQCNRFMAGSDQFNGVSYNKAPSASKAWIAILGQDLPGLGQGLGASAIKNNMFESGAPAGAIVLSGPRSGLAAIVKHAVIEENDFNTGADNAPAIVSDECRQLDVIANCFGIGAAGLTTIQIKNYDRFHFERNMIGNGSGSKVVQWGAPSVGAPAPTIGTQGYAYLDENPDFTYDSSLGQPKYSVQRLNGEVTEPFSQTPLQILTAALLTGWYRADTVVLGAPPAIATFTDKSGNGNDLTQANAALRMTQIAGGVNGQTKAHGDGTQSASRASAIVAETHFAFWFVHQSRTNALGIYQILCNVGNAATGMGLEFSGGTTRGLIRNGGLESTDGPAIDDGFEIWYVQYDGTVTRFFVNGIEMTVTNPGAAPVAPAAVTELFARAGALLNTGDFYEWIACNNVPTASEIADVNRYLRARYVLPHE